jgi:hypothetical protein
MVCPCKITGVKTCQAIRKQFNKDYVSLMPTNLYGYFDNFDLETSHVLPAMLRKFYEAKLNNTPVKLWGSGTPMRFYIHGEVKQPGGYPYQPGMTVNQAVALAGGFTERASQEKIAISREGSKVESERGTINSVIQAGDTITIEQRFF